MEGHRVAYGRAKGSVCKGTVADVRAQGGVWKGTWWRMEEHRVAAAKARGGVYGRAQGGRWESNGNL